MKPTDQLLLRAERLKAEAAALQQQSRAQRELRQLERDLDATTRKLVRALRPYGVIDALGNTSYPKAIIAAEDPAAIILDLLMPEMDGFEVLHHLSTHAPYMLRRVIVMTAAMGPRVDDCRELSRVWHFFRKPMDIDQLSASLIACLAAPVEKAGRGSHPSR